MKMMIKEAGMSFEPHESELDLTYSERYKVVKTLLHSSTYIPANPWITKIWRRLEIFALHAEILVRNPYPRLFGKKFRDSKK